ncbi:MAG TPA: hypothetical protein V6C89_08510 [Drouetiella sp.]
MSSDHDPNNGKNGGTAQLPPLPPPASAHAHTSATIPGPPQASASPHQCPGCGDSSHILYPLADLLKAVASSLQSQSGHSPEQVAERLLEENVRQTNVQSADQSETVKTHKEIAQPNSARSFIESFAQTMNTPLFKPQSKAESAPAQSKSPPLSPHPTNAEPIANKDNGDPNSQAIVDPKHANNGTEKSKEPRREESSYRDQKEENENEEDKEDAADDEKTIDEADVTNLADAPATMLHRSHNNNNNNNNNSHHHHSNYNRRKFPTKLINFLRPNESSSNAEEDETAEGGVDEWGDPIPQKPKPKRFKVWQGLDGIAVMMFGVVIPATILAASCASVPKRLTLVLLDHPVETIVELLLLALIPLTNYAMWSAFRKDDVRLTLKRGIALGSSMITSLAVSGISMAALCNSNQTMLETEIGTSFDAGFIWLSVIALAAAMSTGYIVYSFRKTLDFARSRRLIVAYTAAGAALTTATILGSEANQWNVRQSERMAVSTNKQERLQGLERLRPIFSERSMRMECTDSRAAGLSGLFFPIKDTPHQELYFRMTGKPFSFKDEHNDIAVMPDDYVTRHAVGDKIKGLGLVRSEMSAAVQPSTLTTAVDWTFVFGNESNNTDQARTEISVPPGAVITGMTEWVNGQQIHGTFTGGKNRQDTSWSSATSAAVTDLGHGRALLRCSAVPAGAQLKMNVKMIVPLKPESVKTSEGRQTASLLLPKLIATNYSVEDENVVQLYSPLKLSSDFAELKKTSSNGVQRLAGTLEGKRLESAEVLVTVERPDPEMIAVLDKTGVRLKAEDDRLLAEKQRAARGSNYAPLPQQLTVIVDGRQGLQQQLNQLATGLNHHRDAHGLKPSIKTVKPLYVVQDVTRVKSTAPKHLLIVVDGSEAMKPHLSELKQALTQKSIPVDHVEMMIASQDHPELSRKVSLDRGVKLLEEKNFSAGQNNLRTVIDAAEEAGSAKGGAVLWIHGPQPISSGEVYITTPYAAHPALYELPIANGEIDTAEFFKNHSDIGQFMQVSHKSKLDTDVACFFDKWQPDNIDYVVAMNGTNARATKVREISEVEGKGILQLNAYNKCMQLLSEHKSGAAARIAVAYGVLTPVSSIVIEQAEESAQADENAQSDAPSLQGATNGTIGPQGTDATFITGVNTAGTVRVNNLANLEALLNIIANGMEILGVVWGGATMIMGFMRLGSGADGAMTRIFLGSIGVAGGLCTPGVINWLVASARDANLFS